jgi:hypothetical protein
MTANTLMQQLEQFAVNVRAYCDFVRDASALPLTQRLIEAQAQLLRLYTAALALPELPEDFEDVERPPPARPTLESFGEKEVYWEVFDPYVPTEAGCGSLTDDLLDVHDDVRRGLVLWDHGHRDAALWEWRFNFEIHWGDHCIDALRALHRACTELRRTI